MGDADDIDAGQIVYDNANNSMQVKTNGSERMRIDSSGNVGIGTSSPATALDVLSGSASVGALKVKNASGASASTPILEAVNGGGNTRLIVLNDGNVGIGTSSPNDKVDISGSTGDGYRLTDGTHTGVFRSISGGTILKTTTNHALLFGTNDTEAMRIDSSGNLLVGKTNDADSGDGVRIRSDGLLQATRSNADPLSVNRASSDGDIAVFRKDGSAVGSIGSYGGGANTYLNSSGSVLSLRIAGGDMLTLTNGNLYPTTDSGVNLGLSNRHFGDLHLSGGIFFGDAGSSGTSTSNELDSYEEGTFTPAFQNVATPSYTVQTGTYTKIGRMVHVAIIIEYSALNTGDGSSLNINLPFAASAQGVFHLAESSSNTGFNGTNTISLIGSTGAGSSAFSFGSTGNYNDGDYNSGNWNQSGALRFAGSYPAS